jgi:DNA helicase HerA-like ATPase
VDIIGSGSEDDIRKGDYLRIDDLASERSLIVQVINSGYADIPGILEEILRSPVEEDIRGAEIDLLQVKSYIDIIKDSKIYNCKIRGALENGELSEDISWIPSRSSSKLTKLSDKLLLKIAKIGQEHPIKIGRTKNGSEFSINVADIDGKLNIITGKKETGKSHLSKTLILGLVSYGGICVVFDINGEYINLGYTESGDKNDFYDKILVITPGRDFKVTLEYAGLYTIIDLMTSVLDLPSTSTWELRKIWAKLAKEHDISLKRLGEAIHDVRNDLVRDALLRRHEILEQSRIFTDEIYESTTLEECFYKIRNGGALIVNLHNTSSVMQKIIVEFILSKLTSMLEKETIKALFLLAEEAHLYLKDTYWDDIVTRMRHLGVFTTFITNQPDSIREGIYRQADNIFLFNFTNDHDLEIVSRAARVDAETVNIIARELPPRHCLVLGKIVNDFPLVIKVNPIRAKTMGSTRLFFTDLYKK